MGINKDERYKANRSKLYPEKDLMHGKKGKKFQEAFDKTFRLKPL